MYLTVEATRQVKLAYNKHMYKDLKNKETAKALENYNEFEL